MSCDNFDRNVEALGTCTHRAARSKDLRRALLCAISAVFGRRATRSKTVESFLRRKEREFNLRGDCFLKQFKACCSSTRQSVYNGKKSSSLGFISPYYMRRPIKIFQYLKVARALPPPCACTLKNEITEFKLRVSTPAPACPEAVLKRFDGLSKWAIKPTATTFRHYQGCSASYQHSRREGGRGSRLTGVDFVIHPNFRANPMRVPSRVSFAVTPNVKTRDGKVVALAELGCKSRILTKSDEDLVALGHSYREPLFSLLTKFGHLVTSAGIKDPDLVEIRFPGARKGAVVFSGDLSAATDYLSREVISRVCKALNVDEKTVYVDTVDGEPCLRGTSMGLPPSWPILSICHYQIAGEVDPRHNFLIKGDDIIAYWTPQQIEEYISKMLEIGFLVNTKKSFRSLQYGTFCEVDYIRRKDTLHRLGTFPLRSYVRGIPLTSDTWRLAVSRGVSTKLLYQMDKCYNHKFIHLCKKHKVNPYAPMQAGGGDCCPKQLDRLTDNGTASIIRGLHNGFPIVPEIPAQTGGLLRSITKQTCLVRWSVHGRPELTEHFQSVLGSLQGALATIDCAEGTLKIVEPESMYHRIRHISRYAREMKRMAPPPFPTSYATSYDVVRRLNVVDEGPFKTVSVPRYKAPKGSWNPISFS